MKWGKSLPLLFLLLLSFLSEKANTLALSSECKLTKLISLTL